MEYFIWYLIGVALALIELYVVNFLIDHCKEFRDFYGFSIYDKLSIDRVIIVSLFSWIVLFISGFVIIKDIVEAKK